MSRRHSSLEIALASIPSAHFSTVSASPELCILHAWLLLASLGTILPVCGCPLSCVFPILLLLLDPHVCLILVYRDKQKKQGETQAVSETKNNHNSIYLLT